MMWYVYYRHLSSGREDFVGVYDTAKEAVHKIAQCRKNPDIPLGDYIPVLVPEVPDVSQEIQRLCLVCRNSTEERDESGLSFSRIGHIESQMHIRYEICQMP